GGQPVTTLVKGEKTTETGTTQTFWADPEIFETTDYDFETLRARFQQMAFLNKGLSITLTDERPDHVVSESDDADAPAESRSVTYKYDGGLVDYVTHLNHTKKVDLVHPDVISIESEDPDGTISV